MGLWADTIKVMKSKLFADTLKSGNYEVDRARKDRNGMVIDQTYATIANLNDGLVELQHLLEGGDIVVEDANWAQRAFEDENGYNIAHTYATDSNARQYVSSLEQMLVDGQLIVGEATRAMLDDRGNAITDTYATKDEVADLGQGLDSGQFVVAAARQADYAEDARQAQYAENAGQATNDGNGHNIVNTYATKNQLEQAVDELGHNISDGEITPALAVKANYLSLNNNTLVNKTSATLSGKGLFLVILVSKAGKSYYMDIYHIDSSNQMNGNVTFGEYSQYVGNGIDSNAGTISVGLNASNCTIQRIIKIA